jgi:hypothetical protein
MALDPDEGRLLFVSEGPGRYFWCFWRLDQVGCFVFDRFYKLPHLWQKVEPHSKDANDEEKPEIATNVSSRILVNVRYAVRAQRVVKPGTAGLVKND